MSTTNTNKIESPRLKIQPIRRYTLKEDKKRFLDVFLACLKHKAEGKPFKNEYKSYYNLCIYMKKKFKISGKPTELIPLEKRSELSWLPEICFKAYTKEYFINGIDSEIQKSRESSSDDE